MNFSKLIFLHRQRNWKSLFHWVWKKFILASNLFFFFNNFESSLKYLLSRLQVSFFTNLFLTGWASPTLILIILSKNPLNQISKKTSAFDFTEMSKRQVSTATVTGLKRRGSKSTSHQQSSTGKSLTGGFKKSMSHWHLRNLTLVLLR